MTFRRGPVFGLYEGKAAKRHKLFTAGKSISIAPAGWGRFVAEVAEAAAKARPKRKGQSKPVPNSSDPTRLHPPRLQCDYQMASGKRCSHWPIRGATRCRHHGGYRQAPGADVTIRLFMTGEIDEADRRMKAQAELGKVDPAVLKAARSAIKERCGTKAVPSHILLEGCNLMEQDDGGVAWRRYLAGLPVFKRRDVASNPVGGRVEGEQS